MNERLEVWEPLGSQLPAGGLKGQLDIDLRALRPSDPG